MIRQGRGFLAYNKSSIKIETVGGKQKYIRKSIEKSQKNDGDALDKITVLVKFRTIFVLIFDRVILCLRRSN